jgi:hypothetical protein
VDFNPFSTASVIAFITGVLASARKRRQTVHEIMRTCSELHGCAHNQDPL